MDLEEISDKIKLTLDHINRTIEETNMAGLSKKADAMIDKANESLTAVEKTLARAEDIFDDNRRTINKIIEELKLVMENANKLLEKGSLLATGPVEKTLVRIEGIVSDNEKTIRTTLQELKLAVENANKLFKKGSTVLTGADETLDNFNRHQLFIAQDLEMAGENLNRLIEVLAQQPSQLIFGQPPFPRKVDKY
jgi:phospholipid/cholesterol/gamma-HCH transport system substrate-binding protein